MLVALHQVRQTVNDPADVADHRVEVLVGDDDAQPEVEVRQSVGRAAADRTANRQPADPLVRLAPVQQRGQDRPLPSIHSRPSTAIQPSCLSRVDAHSKLWDEIGDVFTQDATADYGTPSAGRPYLGGIAARQLAAAQRMLG